MNKRAISSMLEILIAFIVIVFIGMLVARFVNNAFGHGNDDVNSRFDEIEDARKQNGLSDILNPGASVNAPVSGVSGATSYEVKIGDSGIPVKTDRGSDFILDVTARKTTGGVNVNVKSSSGAMLCKLQLSSVREKVKCCTGGIQSQDVCVGLSGIRNDVASLYVHSRSAMKFEPFIVSKKNKEHLFVFDGNEYKLVLDGFVNPADYGQGAAGAAQKPLINFQIIKENVQVCNRMVLEARQGVNGICNNMHITLGICNPSGESCTIQSIS